MNSKSLLRRSEKLPAWPRFLIMLAGVIVALWPSWASLFDLWSTNSSYSHGFIVAGVSGLVCYWIRPILNRTQVKPLYWVIPVFVILLFTWVVASLAGLQVGHQLVLPLVGWTGILATLGPGAARLALMPFGYLFLAIPVWGAGNFILQGLTVHAVGWGLDWLSIPALLDGNFVFIASGTFEIADGCGGIHFFIVALATSILFSYLHIGDFRRGALLVLLACGLSMFANWIRVFMIVYAGYVSDMQHYIVKEEHYVWGWFVFAFFLIPFFIIGRRLAGDLEESESTNQTRVRPKNPIETHTSLLAVFICVSLMAGTSAWLHLINQESTARPPAIILPQQVGNWRQQSGLADQWQPVFRGADAEALTNYAIGENAVSVYANLYVKQAQGKELIGYYNRIKGDNSWEEGALSDGFQRPSNAQPGGASYMRVTRLTGEERLVLYWYDVDGRLIKSELAVKLAQGFSRIYGSALSGFVAVSAPCEPDCSAAAVLIDRWLHDFAGQSGAILSLPELANRAIIQ